MFLAQIPAAYDALFQAAVTDPERKGDLVSGYVSYKVTSTREAGGKETQSSVYRRFSDFAWLHDALLAKVFCSVCFRSSY